MINRIKHFVEEPQERPPAGDFWAVSTECGWFYVSAETAAAIERRLTRWWAPRWIGFRDLSGSRIRLRSRHIESVCESTAAQRERDRGFRRARREEDREDHLPWEEDW